MGEVLTGSAELAEGVSFRATSGSGHRLTLDGSPAAGGADLGPLPMELLLLGLAGCGGIDVISILRKKRQAVTGYRVAVAGERAGEHPRVFTRITVEHTVTGHGVDPNAVRRAIELSAGRYCPAAAMLGRTAAIEERFRVIDEATGVETTGTVAAEAGAGAAAG